MKSINSTVVQHSTFYTAHKNYLSSIIGDNKVADFGGIEFPRSYTVFFLQNPELPINIFQKSNQTILPSKEVVNTLLHTDTIRDIPWIHSRVGKIKRVLITDVEFGEIITSVNEVYKTPNIDIIAGSDAFNWEIANNFDNVLGFKGISETLYSRRPYDAIIVGKLTSKSIDYNDFVTTFYDALSPIGEIILIVDSDDFKSSYESFESFRNLFNEFGYTSSIKNIGHGNDLIVHFRKQSPDYATYENNGEQFPNVYIHSLISRIEDDPILHIGLKKLKYSDRESAIYKLIYKLRVEKFMYLPKVEEHIEFINNHIEHYSRFML